MAIDGMTKNVNPSAPVRSIQRTGKIYKGLARTEEDIAKKRPGQETDYFRVEFPKETAEQKAFAEAVLYPTFKKLYGDKPLILPNVFLLDQEVDQAFPTWLDEWGKSGLIRRCDGKHLELYRDAEGQMVRSGVDGESSLVPCKAPQCECKKHGTLRFLLNDFVRETGVIGFFQLDTHSTNDIISIHGMLTLLKRTAGTLNGIPLQLTREPRAFEIPYTDKQGNKRITKSTKHLVVLKVDPKFVKSTFAELLNSGSTPQLESRSIDSNGEIHDHAPESEDINEYEDAVAEPPHWSKVPALIQHFDSWKKRKGFAHLELPKPIYEYGSGAEAGRALQDIADQQAKVEQIIKDNEEANRRDDMTAGDGLTLIDLERLCDEFTVTPEGIFEILGVKDWSDLGTLKEAKAKVIGYAFDNNWAVLVERCRYETMSKDHNRMIFKTSLGDITLWGGRNELIEAAVGAGVDPDYWSDVKDWLKQGTHDLPEALVLHWTENKKFNRLEVDHFEIP